MEFALFPFLMALAGFTVHLLGSWGEHRKAKDTPTLGLWQYVTLDAPAWLSALVAVMIAYFGGPDIAALFNYENVTMSPGISAVAGYGASSAGPKLLGLIVARASPR